MKRHALFFSFFVLMLCGCNSGGNDHFAENSSADKVVLPLNDSTKVNIINQEIEDLMSEYEEDKNPETLNQALQLNDSLEKIDATEEGRFQQTLTRAQLLASMGHMKEAMRLQESLLNDDPDDFVRLQFYTGKYMIEGKTDSMHLCANRAIATCDQMIANSSQNADAMRRALSGKMVIYQIIDEREKARLVNEQLLKLRGDDSSREFGPEAFDREYDAAREELNRSAVAWRNDTGQKL